MNKGESLCVKVPDSHPQACTSWAELSVGVTLVAGVKSAFCIGRKPF